MGLFRQEYWSGLHALLPGIFLTQGPDPYLLCLLHGQAGPLPLTHTVVQIFSFLANLCLPVLSVVKRRALKFVMIIRYLSISPFSFVSFLFMYFETLICSVYTYMILYLPKDMATRSSILAWKIPQTEEPGGYSPWGHKESDRTERLSTHSTMRWSFSRF